ncbi:extensin family protein [Sphingomonas radiodurans]|uniref:extensin family protein n=1 Tax=Sphingomonas radiodurans TaxID=2890321 RepID=UPI001E5B180A|nr:extensin family protein [Sphingomonas radiodurans]WBH17523.1 extensin family protein [Sphingomonas radiodurans]
MRTVIMLALIVTTLAACGRSDRPSRPDSRNANKKVEGPSARETAMCQRDLRELGVDFEVLPDRQFGPGCGIVGTVKLLDIGVPTTNLGAVRCGQARTYAQWARNAVAPAAYQMLGSELAKIESMGSYNCRNVAGTGRRSGHAIANAIDIGGFQLKDGRRITILKDWNSPDPDVRRFLQTISASACKRFGTTLGPNYNAAHRNHLHLEDDKANFCR